MKAINKGATIPKSLIDSKRTEIFNSNKELKLFPANNTDYKTNDVFKQLKIIYNCKCAFCEYTLLNSPKHIDHYRPKNKDDRRENCCADMSYFWLAFSWDNLLLACNSCNSSKGSCFDIEGTRADYEEKYKNYSLDELQNIIKELDTTEKPLLVNPEQEDQSFFDNHLKFNYEGKISSDNKRLNYTIRVCNLNREELVTLRLELINDLRNTIRRRKADYKIGLTDSANFCRNIALLHKDWQEKLLSNPKFSALYKYFDNNFGDFIKTIEN